MRKVRETDRQTDRQKERERDNYLSTGISSTRTFNLAVKEGRVIISIKQDLNLKEIVIYLFIYLAIISICSEDIVLNNVTPEIW